MEKPFPRGKKKILTVRFLDANGERVSRSTGTTNMAEAMRIGVGFEREAREEKMGLANPDEARFLAEEKRPIAELIAAYETHQTVTGKCPLYIKQSAKILKLFCKTTGVYRLPDLSMERYDFYLRVRMEGGNSTLTCNYVTAVLKRFSAWLFETRKSRINVFEKAKKQKNITLSKRKARAMTERELAWLIDHTKGLDQPLRRKMEPERRAIMYLLAACTGLRAGELCSLTSASFDWVNLTVTVEAAYSKNRKETVQPLSADVAREVRPLVNQLEDGQRLFDGAKGQTPKLIDADMLAAREAWIKAGETDAEKAARLASDFLSKRDAQKKVLHFHALRHTYVTMLRLSGHDPKLIQDMARHSDIKLTMGIYTHVLPAEIKAAAPRLPQFA